MPDWLTVGCLGRGDGTSVDHGRTEDSRARKAGVEAGRQLSGSSGRPGCRGRNSRSQGQGRCSWMAVISMPQVFLRLKTPPPALSGSEARRLVWFNSPGIGTTRGRSGLSMDLTGSDGVSWKLSRPGASKGGLCSSEGDYACLLALSTLSDSPVWSELGGDGSQGFMEDISYLGSLRSGTPALPASQPVLGVSLCLRQGDRAG